MIGCQTADSEEEELDLANYKGVFYDDDPTTKYTDPETGAHFDFEDVSERLNYVKLYREQEEKTS